LSIHPAYFTTRFRVEPLPPSWPASFVIVTAYATTGEQWSEEENERADAILRRRLGELGVWIERITGFDPATGHAEPGWAVEIDLATGVSLGREYRQDAIFHVEGDRLAVVSCAEQGVASVGSFRERVLPAATQALASDTQRLDFS
jgi:uncharacterized protein with GYD domain